MATKAQQVTDVVKQIKSTPKLRTMAICDDVIIDIVNSQAHNKDSEIEPTEEHEFGSPPAFTSGLINKGSPGL